MLGGSNMKKVLIVGESWTVQETHVKGFDTVDLGRLEQDSSSHHVEALKKRWNRSGLSSKPSGTVSFSGYRGAVE